MRNFLDVYDRALKGPVMSDSNFEMKRFMPKVNEVVEKYEIR